MDLEGVDVQLARLSASQRANVISINDNAWHGEDVTVVADGWWVNIAVQRATKALRGFQVLQTHMA